MLTRKVNFAFSFHLDRVKQVLKKICKVQINLFTQIFFLHEIDFNFFPYRTENIHTCIIGKTVFGWWLGVKRRAQFCSQGLRTSREP